MKSNLKKGLLAPVLFLFAIANSPGQNGNLGIFENHLDIGQVKNHGFVNFDPVDQQYLIGGAGENMWAGKDELHYLWKSIQGDFIARAEVSFIGEGVDPHRKVGWTIRDNLSTGSAMVNATVHGDGLTSLQFRRSTGAETEEVKSSDQSPEVIQLERRGGTYIMSTGKFGEALQSVQLEMELRNEAFLGIYVCSHNPDVMERAVFRNVRIIKPPAADYQPYQDYIGSHLEIMDIATGNRKILASSAHSIQAPNWTTDGKTLLFNSNGFLYNYDLADGKIRQLNTGFANRNNNDHVISFDGNMVAISHHNPADNGASSLYTMPISGSDNPKKITKDGVGNSYLHGWSTDHKFLVFTGNRKDRYDIYKVSVETGEETQLTDQPTLDDGPEYSPDGAYIYFNSARSGMMKLWRMKPDGTQKEQVTFGDTYNDWFPHISPDNKWIVFLSYGTDVEPSDHPFYKHVVLRLMPVAGGEPKIVGYVYGGQGTINVPSWSPDSKKIAFVSNTAF
ncbi:MAG: TolB family protein [Cyclobacteriaceae bacterium]